MNKRLTYLAFLFLSGNLFAQPSNSDIKKLYGVTTTLFEYGEPVKSTEANFRNLFKNFPLFIKNAGENLKLLSYKHVGEIKDRKDIKEYLDKNTKLYKSEGGTTLSLGGTDPDFEQQGIWMHFPTQSQTSNKISEAQLKDELVKIANNIHPGDEVYLLNFTAEGINYEFYMFVNPKTRVVLEEGNFLAMDIPLKYADFYSKKNKAGK